MKPIKAFVLCFIFLILTAPLAVAQVNQAIEDSKNILPLRERVKITEKWWRWKYKNVLPMVMREQGVQMWIIRDDEADLYYNNNGPVYVSLLLADHQGMAYPSKHVRRGSQRIPSFLVFFDNGEEIEYIEPRDYDQIGELVREKDPENIAIAEHNKEQLVEALGKKYTGRTVDSWTLGVRWLETVGPERVSVYKQVQRVACEVIAEAFSNRVVTPDITTTEDINWWILHKYQELGLDMENYPSVIVKRNDENMEKYPDEANFFRNGRTNNSVSVTVRRGDVISLDTDLYMYGLITDSHQHAYVLRNGETDVPQELKDALVKVNTMQDLFRKEFQVGRTGKEIVAAAEKIDLIVQGFILISLNYFIICQSCSCGL